MSAADEAWQEWHKDASNDGFVRRCQHTAFLAGYQRALEDAADEQERLSTGPRAMGSKAVQFKRMLFAEWLRNRAKEVGNG